MSRVTRSGSIKRSTNRKTAGCAQFDPTAFLKTAAKGRKVSTHPQKQIIFAQGEAADSVHYILSGKVKVTVLSHEGKEAVVAILGVDEFFGEGCLIGQPKRLATAMAMTECVTMQVEKRAGPANLHRTLSGVSA